MSEYVPAAYMRRGYLTDFHGSAGTALVLTDDAACVVKNDDGDDGKGAYLWTDSRLVHENLLFLLLVIAAATIIADM